MLVLGSLLSLPVLSAANPPPITAVKVMIKQPGFCRVTEAQLATAFGISTSSVATKVLHVENMGLEVASKRDGGDIVFFGKGFQSLYTDENVYWIVDGQAAALVQQAVGAAIGTPAPSFPDKAILEQELILRSDLYSDASEDPWLWRLLTSGLSIKQYSTTMILPGLLSGTGGALTVRVKGATDTTGKYLHGVQVSVNGTVLGSATFTGLATFDLVVTVPSGVWTTGNNTVKVESVPPPGTSFDSFYLDSIVATYARSYDAAGSRLVVAANGGPVKIVGLNGSDVDLWDVTDAWHAKQLTGFGLEQLGGTWAVNFQAPQNGLYAVTVRGGERPPDGVVGAPDNDLRSLANDVDYLVVCGSALQAEAQNLANYRASVGMKTKVVNMDAVYDAFNYGIRDGRALKTMISYAYRQWAHGPRYVAIVGDGTLDYRNYLGLNESVVPTAQRADLYGQFNSDHILGDVTGDGIPEIAVGRIPILTTNEMSMYLSKMISYENGGSWRDTVLISTDDRDQAGIYINEGNVLQTQFVGRTVERADIEVLGATMARQTLTNGVSSGREVSIYIGHGSAQRLAEEGLMTIPDVQAMTNQTKPGVFMALGCLAGTWGAPGLRSIGESLVDGEGGASAMIGAATFVSTPDSTLMAQSLLQSVYQCGEARLGDAWVHAKQVLVENGRLPAVEGYQLLGDPALSMGDPGAPCGGTPASPARGTYDEWRSWAFAPVWSDAGFATDENGDPDGDGSSNWEEYMAGTDPLDRGSKLVIVKIKQMPGQQVQLTWPGGPGRKYRIERAVLGSPYSPLADDVASALPDSTWVDQVPATGVTFYRIAAK